MADSNLQCLLEMGFSAERGKTALEATKGKDLQAAVEWLFANPDAGQGYKLGSDVEATAAQGQDESISEKGDGEEVVQDGNDKQSQESQQPQSIVCEECGKKFKSEADAQAHAIRTGHQSFAESMEEVKALTDEEKQQQLKRLEERMTERRKEREEMEKQAEIQREKNRRKSGRELTEAKQKMELEEAKRIAEQRRKEKQEEKLIRQKLKQKIAQDRLDQKTRQASAVGVSSTALSAATSLKTTESASFTCVQAKKDYSTCKIQFRLTNGSSLTADFKPTDVFQVVHDYIASYRTDGSSPFSLMTTFPRKTFTEADMNRTLSDLGLVPSTVLVLTK